MAASWPQIVFLGDSLIQNAADIKEGFSFHGAVQNQVIRRFDVVNRGLSGYNTSQTLQILPELFPAPVPGGPKLEYLFILLGANDARLPIPANIQHVPLDEYRANLTAILNHAVLRAHRPKIFVVTPPPLDEIQITKLDLAAGHPAATRQHKVSAAYSQAAREIAAAHAASGVVLVDLFRAVMDRALAKTPGFDPAGPPLGDPESGRRGHLEHLLPDGLHMSGEAYEVFYDIVKPHLGSEWAGTPDEQRVGYVFPDWTKAPWLSN